MRWLFLGLVAFAACHKVSDERVPQTADALWKLAPEGATLGFVITPRGLAMLEHGWQDLHAFAQKAPEMADAAKILDDRLRAATGIPELRLADYGLTADKAVAAFLIDRRTYVLVMPLADRDRYLARSHGKKGSDVDTIDRGTCKTIRGYYVCATSSELFGKLGKGTLRKVVDARGDIELAADHFTEMDGIDTLALAFDLEPGGVILHGTMTGPTTTFAAELGNALKPDVDREHSAGFGVVDTSKAREHGDDEVIAAGVTDAAIAKSIVGPVNLSVPAGQLAIDLRVPLLDPAPLQRILDHCSESAPPDLHATSSDGMCHILVPTINLGIDGWIADKTLHVGMKHAAPGVALHPTRGELDLAGSAWNFALWGRGSLLALPALPLPPELLADHDVRSALRALLLVNEVGFAFRADGDKLRFAGVLRTAFANPDDVVAKLATVPLDDVIAGKGAAAVPTNGSAPLADDIKAGFVGLALPAALIAVAAKFADEP